MIKKLQTKKGFTIIELIVVIAIIAVLSAVILPQINTDKARITEANSAARDFYAAIQTTFTKYSLFDNHLSPTYKAGYGKVDAELDYMAYYPNAGGNFPYEKQAHSTATDLPQSTNLFIEVQAKNGQIVSVKVDTSRASISAVQEMYYFVNFGKTDTELSRLIENEIDQRISYRDGYYYAKVSYTAPSVTESVLKGRQNVNTVKVAFAAYSRKRLPATTGMSDTTYANNCLTFGEDYVLKNGEICGVCAPYNPTSKKVIGEAGSILM